MSNVETDAPIVVSKELRNRIKVNAAKAGQTMRIYLDRLVPKEVSNATTERPRKI